MAILNTYAATTAQYGAQGALEWANAEMADAQKKCPCAVPYYQNAVLLANQAILMGWDPAQITAIEAELVKARAAWHGTCGCGTAPPAPAPTGGVLKAGMGSGGLVMLALGLGIVAALLYGKKGPGGSSAT